MIARLFVAPPVLSAAKVTKVAKFQIFEIYLVLGIALFFTEEYNFEAEQTLFMEALISAIREPSISSHR